MLENPRNPYGIRSSFYAAERAALADATATDAYAEYERLLDRADSRKSSGWRTRDLREADRVYQQYQQAVRDNERWTAEFEKRVSREESRAKPRKPKKKKPAAAKSARKVKRRKPEPVEPVDIYGDEYADEWEIGLNYSAIGGGGHDLDVNVRVRRTDRRTMHAREMQRVLTTFRSKLKMGAADPIPAGYEMLGIEWRRPVKASARWHRGDFSDLENLQNVMAAVADNVSAWRIGSVE